MNMFRFVVAWILCAVSLTCAGWFVGLLMEDLVPHEVQLIRFFAFGFFLILSVALFALAEYFRKSVKWLPQAPDRRPVVCMWEHDGDITITSEAVYRLSLGFREQLLVVFHWVNKDKYRVMPLIFAYRSNKRCDPGLKPEELQAILDSCMVQKVEMQSVPERGWQIGFGQMWRLLHGPNSQPPTVAD